MSGERLTPRAITPIEQHFDASCVPASISMALSGFGIDISEQTLIDKYFPTAELPILDPNTGVKVFAIVEGMVAILQDLGLQTRLQIDVFDPNVWRCTSSREEKYIIKASPRALSRYRKEFNSSGDCDRFYKSLEALAKENRIGVYTANRRMLNFSNLWWDSDLPNNIERGFFNELSAFIRKGHIVGPHGGLTAHVRILDGTKTTETDFWLINPAGSSHYLPRRSLVLLDAQELRGDTFDYLFRVSPQEEVLKPQGYGIRGFLQNLRQLLPR